MNAKKINRRRAEQQFAGLFDRSGTVRPPPRHRLLNEAQSIIFYRPPPPRAVGPEGSGHVVLVVPGFLTNDKITEPLRAFLGRCGYRAVGWELGVNWGPTPDLLQGLRRRLDALLQIEQGPISLIGVSLGGLLVRDLAHDRPQDVRQIITIVSPFRLPTASTIEPLVRLCMRFYSPDVDPFRVSLPLPVPSMAIHTRDDGLVAWESCIDEDGCNLEVSGQHITICRNPEVLRAVARRLGNEQPTVNRQGPASAPG